MKRQALADADAAADAATATAAGVTTATGAAPAAQNDSYSSAPSAGSSASSFFSPTDQLTLNIASTPTSDLSYGYKQKVPREIAHLLKFHRDNLNHCHYFLTMDPFDFFTHIVDVAPTCEPLMYALASFSAYHYALGHGERHLVDMFEYYEQCLRSLRQALADPDILVLSAVLILSCIEMYLGDVSNEVQHQDVVFHLFQTVYTPDNFFVDQYHLHFFIWLRFIDNRRSLLSGRYMIFDAKWSNIHRTILARSSLAIPNAAPDSEVAIKMLMYKYITDLGTLFSEVCTFAADIRKEVISGARAIRQIEIFRVKSMTWLDCLDHALFETVELPANHALSPTELETLSPIIYKRAEIGFIMIIYYSWKLYFSSYTALSTTGTIEDPQGTSEIAIMAARIVCGFKATARTRPGALFVVHNYLCMAALFLPQRLHVWVRRTVAHIQALGYHFPDEVRWQLAAVWKDKNLYKGWLEGLEPEDESVEGVVIPWQRLLQVKIPDMNEERMGLTASMMEMRGIFNTGVDRTASDV